VMTGLGLAMLLTLATNVKQGTGLNILVPIEAVLLPVALAGAVLALRSRETFLAVLGVVPGLAFTFVQSAALLLSPARTVTLFIYPGSTPGAWGRLATDAQVEREAAAARRCPAGSVYSGVP